MRTLLQRSHRCLRLVRLQKPATTLVEREPTQIHLVSAAQLSSVGAVHQRQQSCHDCSLYPTFDRSADTEFEQQPAV